MTRTISPANLEKLIQGRRQRLAETTGLVCIINGEYSIWCDEYNFSLRHKGRDERYYTSIESILEDIQTDKEKALMLASATKDLLSVRQAIIEARRWMEEVVRPLFQK
ncbi:MAG: hypothetical protein KGJ93_01535 [Patescibacteria group bacterium]|nr:hypothetical protein [Patescibacteria group bacterium]